MHNSVTTRLQTAKEAILAGDGQSACKNLLLASKRGKPNPRQRVTLSEYWTWIGDDPRALKVLGPLKSPYEMKSLNEEALLVELRKAYILGMAGARHLGLYLFERITQLLETPLKEFYPQAFQNRGYLFLSAGDFEQAIEAFEAALALYQKGEHQHFFISLGLHDCHLALGQFKEANDMLQTLGSQALEQRELEAILNQVLGESLQTQGKPQEAIEFLEKSLELFSDSSNKDKAYAHKHLGIAHLKLENKEEAISQLQQAQDLLHQNLATPMAMQEVYFWMFQAEPQRFPRNKFIALLAHPSFGMLSASLRGQEGIKEAHWMLPFKGMYPQNGLHIREQARPTDYGDILSKDLECFLDLQSGLLRADTITILDPTSNYCLLALIGAGDLGVTESLLFDFVFRDQFVTFEHAQDRLKKAIKKLSKMGFQIERRKSIYFYNGYKKEIDIYLPFKKENLGVFHYLNFLFPHGFTTGQVKESLNLTLRSAQRLCKDWLDSGEVVKQNPNLYTLTNPYST